MCEDVPHTIVVILMNYTYEDLSTFPSVTYMQGPSISYREIIAIRHQNDFPSFHKSSRQKYRDKNYDENVSLKTSKILKSAWRMTVKMTSQDSVTVFNVDHSSS